MIRTVKIVLGVSIIALMLSAYGLLDAHFLKSDSDIYVVEVMGLFNGFKMKQEIEASVAAKVEVYKRQIDSNAAAYNYALKSIDKKNVPLALAALERKNNELKAKIEEINQQANEQIWNRLNALIEDYGKSHRARLIVGANGLGSVMYNADNIDKTKEILEYVNDKYEKGIGK